MGHEFWWSCSTKLMRSVFGNGLFDVVVLLILNFWVVATVVVPNNQRMIMGLPMGLKLEHPTGIILCLLSWYSNGICQLLFKNDKIASNGTRETASRITKEQKNMRIPTEKLSSFLSTVTFSFVQCLHVFQWCGFQTSVLSSGQNWVAFIKFVNNRFCSNDNQRSRSVSKTLAKCAKNGHSREREKERSEEF